jgi:hypothetical protein
LTFVALLLFAVLFQETLSVLNETRHLVCNTCGGNFHGISIPTRKKLLSSVCGEELAASLQTGSFLVASRSNSERAVSTNFPALVAALFKLKRAHWKYAVYFVFSFGVPGEDDLEGDSKVFALNLTRLMDGSADCPIPDEVLSQQQLLRESSEREAGTESKLSSDSDHSVPCFPTVIIKHHNGGPVKWSSYRSGMLVVDQEALLLQQQLQQRGFESDTDAANRTGDPAAVFLSSFLVIPLSPTSCLIVGKFSIVMEIVQSIRHMFEDGSEIVVFSYSGYAEWSKAQLLREIARGSWGVVRPDTALIACEELIHPSPAYTAADTASCPSAYPSLDDLSCVPKVASHSVNQSCCARDWDDRQQEEHNTETNDSVKAQGGAEGSEVDSKVLLALAHDSDDDGDLPPIPKPARTATRGSITRARSASNTAAFADASSPDMYLDEKEGKQQQQQQQVDDLLSAMWREMFSDLDEGNIWDKMIEISMESGDNVIRQSYS